jgi:hypothetical protein
LACAGDVGEYESRENRFQRHELAQVTNYNAQTLQVLALIGASIASNTIGDTVDVVSGVSSLMRGDGVGAAIEFGSLLVPVSIPYVNDLASNGGFGGGGNIPDDDVPNSNRQIRGSDAYSSPEWQYRISNLNMGGIDNLEHNTAAIDAIQPGYGAGWTGAFDRETQQFVLLPSSEVFDTRLRETNTVPPGTVMRTGGHGFAQSILVDELSIPRVQDELDSRIIGFHLSYTQEGQIAIGWKSGTLNHGRNDFTIVPFVKPEYQEEILAVIRQFVPEHIEIVNLGTPFD